jgi:hypothetical protein
MICDRVAEAQANLHDHSECRRYTPEVVVARLEALISEEGLLRAMANFGYYPSDTPPPVTLANH